MPLRFFVFSNAAQNIRRNFSSNRSTWLLVFSFFLFSDLFGRASLILKRTKLITAEAANQNTLQQADTSQQLILLLSGLQIFLRIFLISLIVLGGAYLLVTLAKEIHVRKSEFQIMGLLGADLQQIHGEYFAELVLLLFSAWAVALLCCQIGYTIFGYQAAAVWQYYLIKPAYFLLYVQSWLLLGWSLLTTGLFFITRRQFAQLERGLL